MSGPYNQQTPYGGNYQNQPQGQSYCYDQNDQQQYQPEGYYQQTAPYTQDYPQQQQQQHYSQYQDQQQLQQPSFPSDPQNQQTDSSSDRGLGGALTGGLAGGFSGHQAGHGFLGTLGGAIIGSFAEDKLKKYKMRKEEECAPLHAPRPHSAQGVIGYGNGGHAGHGVGFQQNFTESVSFRGGEFGAKK